VGFGLLGHAVETVSGKELCTYLKEAIFDPLGLSTAGVNLAVNETPGVAKRYFYGSQKLPDYDSETPAAGSMFMSAHDLLRFGLFHLKGAIPGQTGAVLTRSSIDEMRTPLRLNDGHLNEQYGLGWEIGGCGSLPSGARCRHHNLCPISSGDWRLLDGYRTANPRFRGPSGFSYAAA
jgi:CubicO group peptidase (beta-lactamase class C family)